MKERLHIAVDGGGTKTISILFRENGEILKGFRKNFGANVWLMQGNDTLEAVSQNMVEMLNELCSEEEWKAVQSVTFTIPGFSIKSDCLKEKLAGKLTGEFSDNEPAYWGALGLKKGICVSAGTGAFAIAPCKEKNEEYFIAGGWGSFDDDAGGGYYVGLLAIRTLFRELERGEYSLLSKSLMALYDVYNRKDIEWLLYEDKKLGRREIAQLSKTVAKCAAEGCEQARQIFEDCAYRLAEYAYVAYLRSMNSEDVPVVLVGGLKQAGDCLILPFKKYLSQFSKRLIYMEPLFENYIGTVIFALGKVGIPLTQSCFDNIEKTKENIR